MGFLIGWLLLSVIVGAFAIDRAMGFWGGFLWSVLLSPVIGLIIVLLSKSKAKENFENQQYYNQQQQTQVLHQLQQQQLQGKPSSVTDELAKLKKQLDEGVINNEEFQLLKGKIIQQYA